VIVCYNIAIEYSIQSITVKSQFLYFAYHSSERPFSVRVDPTTLKECAVHYAEILGFDSEAVEAGPMFRFPVTVIKPARLADERSVSYSGIDFKPGQIERRFVEVPRGAIFAGSDSL
jgi:tripeptidyl-peptidase-2